MEPGLVLCKQGVAGSIPATSTKHLPAISITYLVGPKLPDL